MPLSGHDYLISTSGALSQFQSPQPNQTLYRVIRNRKTNEKGSYVLEWYRGNRPVEEKSMIFEHKVLNSIFSFAKFLLCWIGETQREHNP